jgi:hypothetical protein
MSNAIVSRLGQKNAAGDAKAMFLTVFAGEVLAAFAEVNVMESRSMVRSISSGKTAQFPATWKGTASYHTPGVELLGSQINHNERTISIDDVLIADRFIAQIDEAMNHFDVRQIYSGDVGRALAQTFDKNLQQVGILASQASATVSGGNGGTVITDADANTSQSSLITSIFDAVEYLDSKDVPDEDRFCFLKPAQYYLLIDGSPTVINTDYNPGGNGSQAEGVVRMIGGVDLVKTNNLPQANVTTGPSTYQGTFANHYALVMQKRAIGTVKLLDLSVEMEWDIRRQGTLIVGKYAVGHGILRPECAVSIKTS